MKEPPEQRSRTMRAVKSQNTAPELAVRRWLHSNGYRYRLHSRDLPGKPDIVFPRLRKAIFVHGCFWHGHDCPRGSRLPQANRKYWKGKIARNRKRDRSTIVALSKLGWDSLIVWECEIKSCPKLGSTLREFLVSQPVNFPARHPTPEE
ncbi:MAG TPA: very short patch repair endonuclease [Edaphobacter sp.]|nr:very short patch repair endonuclease [Edaphobacter sp.]